MPPSHPAHPAPACCPSTPGFLLWSKSFLQGRYECLIQSQLGKKKKKKQKCKGCKEDLPPQSRSPPELGHLHRAPVSLIPPDIPSMPPVLNGTHHPLQVDIKYAILHCLHILFSDLCREVGGGQGTIPGSPVPWAALPSFTGDSPPHPGSRPIHQKSIH